MVIYLQIRRAYQAYCKHNHVYAAYPDRYMVYGEHILYATVLTKSNKANIITLISYL